MSTHEPAQSNSSRWRLRAFRAFGGVLVVLAGFGLLATFVGVYLTIKEASISGWLAPLLVCAIGVAPAMLLVVGLRALRIRSVEELEAQSRSKWLEPEA